MSDWAVVWEPALDAWPEKDPELRIKVIVWTQGFRDGPDFARGTQVFGMDDLYSVHLDSLGVTVTYLVRSFHRLVVIKEYRTVRSTPSPN